MAGRLLLGSGLAALVVAGLAGRAYASGHVPPVPSPGGILGGPPSTSPPSTSPSTSPPTTSPSGHSTPGGEHAASDPSLVGLFDISAGSCSGSGAPSGSYFRMEQPGGAYISNGSSPCKAQTYTPLLPGTDGGLSTGGYQPGTDRIIKPASFYGEPFEASTNATDPQTGQKVPVPSISESNGALSGNLSAFSVSWNGQSFNQGAPKPGGTGPGPSGTYSSATGAYTLNWTSLIKGGPFNGFTGVWHLQGTFKAGSTSSSTPSTAPPSTAPPSTASPSGSSSSAPAASSSGVPSSSPTTSPPSSSSSPSSSAASPSASSSATLAYTGFPVLPWLAAALLAIFMGAIVVFGANRWQRPVGDQTRGAEGSS